MKLTPRQVEVLLKICEGLPNKAIAFDLGVSIKTVEKHRQGICYVIGNNVPLMVATAIRLKLLNANEWSRRLCTDAKLSSLVPPSAKSPQT